MNHYGDIYVTGVGNQPDFDHLPGQYFCLSFHNVESALLTNIF